MCEHTCTVNVQQEEEQQRDPRANESHPQSARRRLMLCVYCCPSARALTARVGQRCFALRGRTGPMSRRLITDASRQTPADLQRGMGAWCVTWCEGWSRKPMQPGPWPRPRGPTAPQA